MARLAGRVGAHDRQRSRSGPLPHLAALVGRRVQGSPLASLPGSCSRCDSAPARKHPLRRVPHREVGLEARTYSRRRRPLARGRSEREPRSQRRRTRRTPPCCPPRARDSSRRAARRPAGEPSSARVATAVYGWASCGRCVGRRSTLQKGVIHVERCHAPEWGAEGDEDACERPRGSTPAPPAPSARRVEAGGPALSQRGDLVFCTVTGKRVSERSVNLALAAAKKAAGMDARDDRLSTHAFRHTFVSLAATNLDVPRYDARPSRRSRERRCDDAALRRRRDQAEVNRAIARAAQAGFASGKAARRAAQRPSRPSSQPLRARKNPA